MLPGAKTEATVDSFLKSILRVGLLTRQEILDLVREVPPENRDNLEALAEFLIDRGKLSSFQAQKLLKGTTAGLILGPYQIVSPIGKGGMGSVYLARDTRNRKMVALKILPPKRAREEERMLARFLREMEISKRVAHPHVALTYESGDYHGIYFIAMEYIPGKNLYRLVMEEGTFKVTRAAKIFAEVASGLDHAHSQGLIHRDLKPSNIMITPNGHAKVLDLGLALIEGEVSEAKEIIGGQGYVVGSMDYIAPEQTKDAVGVDARADIYGLGCTLFFALTGQPPFPGGSAKDKIRKHRSEEPPALRELNPDLPLAFVNIVDKMMAKDPEKRYPSAKVLQDVLHEWADGEPSLPLDDQEDQAFQIAVEELERATAPSEVVNAAILDDFADEPAPKPTSRWTSFTELITASEEGDQIYLWLCLGMIGFWVILLIVVGLILLVR